MTALHPEIERYTHDFLTGGGERALVLRSLRGSEVDVSHNAGATIPGASLLKLPLAIAARRNATEFAARTWRVEEIHDTRFPSVLAAFDPSTELSWRDLIGLSLITSDNDAANVLLDELPAETIDAVLEDAGCRNTRLSCDFSDLRLQELDDENLTSAEDMAGILALIYRSEPLICDLLVNNLRNQRIPRLLTPEIRVANKTGSLRRVSNDAALIFGDQTDLLLVVMATSVDDGISTDSEIARLTKAICDEMGIAVEDPDPQAVG